MYIAVVHCEMMLKWQKSMKLFIHFFLSSKPRRLYYNKDLLWFGLVEFRNFEPCTFNYI